MILPREVEFKHKRKLQILHFNENSPPPAWKAKADKSLCIALPTPMSWDS